MSTEHARRNFCSTNLRRPNGTYGYVENELNYPNQKNEKLLFKKNGLLNFVIGSKLKDISRKIQSKFLKFRLKPKWEKQRCSRGDLSIAWQKHFLEILEYQGFDARKKKITLHSISSFHKKLLVLELERRKEVCSSDYLWVHSSEINKRSRFQEISEYQKTHAGKKLWSLYSTPQLQLWINRWQQWRKISNL